MEASTISATAAIAPATPDARVVPARIAAGPLLRLRSDEQLVRLFRGGSDDAFRVIHDRYRTRLFAYARQMLGGSRADAEDALQDVFVRAYGALRANDRDVSLRAWLYRIAHNRCIDELRRPSGRDRRAVRGARAGAGARVRSDGRGRAARVAAAPRRGRAAAARAAALRPADARDLRDGLRRTSRARWT